MPPEQAYELEQEIKQYLDLRNIAESQFDDFLTPFEQRLINAFVNHDGNFFRMLADLCELSTNDWLDDQSDTAALKFLARQCKKELTEQGHPVTRPAIHKRVKETWIGLKSGVPGWSLLLALGKLDEAEREKIATVERRFPESAWKRVWKDPELSDVKKGKSGRPPK
jgi:hypothetical protein